MDLRLPAEMQDLSGFAQVELAVVNRSPRALTIWAGASHAGAEGARDTVRSRQSLEAGERAVIPVQLMRRPEDPGFAKTFAPFIMYFRTMKVRDNTLDPAEVAALFIEIPDAQAGDRLEVLGVRASGEGGPAPVPFFPFVDAYGQYRHTDWPGKVRSDKDFAERLREELEEMANWSGPAAWNRFGGWEAGPRLQATGFFRAEKHEGKWWLVDPEGRLFFSYGPTGVGFGGEVSPITDREHWFSHLPARDDPKFSQFYRDGKGAKFRYYQERSWTAYSFSGANTLKKFGPSAERNLVDLAHRRLRSWGFNTMGAWSSETAYLAGRTPYTAIIHYRGPKFSGLPDVFDSGFRGALRKRLEQEVGKTNEDPWNIGYFVDNELPWGHRAGGAGVTEAALKAPASSPTKRAMVDRLQAKYGEIGRLNEVWKTAHPSWEALLEDRNPVAAAEARVLPDYRELGLLYADEYFRICRDEVKRIAPNHLYLGCRFHGHIDRALLEACARYVDVISYNIYDMPPTGRLRQLHPFDKPVIVGEFSVGANPVQTPLRYKNLLSPNATYRRDGLFRYLEAALVDPVLVGAHFFQYRDHPLTGRPDGEASPRGFVNASDTPHFYLIDANRQISDGLYPRRFGSM